MENDVRLVIRAKNNLLLSRIEERGFSNIAAFCQFVNVSYAMLNGYICMRISRRMRNGDWRKPALDIAEALDARPEDLWSSEQQAMTEPVKVAEVVMSMAEYGRRLAASNPERQIEARQYRELIASAVDKLDPRERQIVRRRFGLETGDVETYGAIGKDVGLSVTRVQEIERRAVRYMQGHLRDVGITKANVDDVEEALVTD
jgi:RNA polymerase sigma factor (sigma-70 family)